MQYMEVFLYYFKTAYSAQDRASTPPLNDNNPFSDL